MMRTGCPRRGGPQWMRPTMEEEEWVASNAWRYARVHALTHTFNAQRHININEAFLGAMGGERVH